MSNSSPWRIVLAPKASKVLRRLGRSDRERLQDAINGLPAGDVKRLQGQQEFYRLRVGGWRVIFVMDPAQQTIFVALISPRGDAYRP